jgi:hypothetical protein
MIVEPGGTKSSREDSNLRSSGPKPDAFASTLLLDKSMRGENRTRVDWLMRPIRIPTTSLKIRRQELNLQPLVYKTTALPIELHRNKNAASQNRTDASTLATL